MSNDQKDSLTDPTLRLAMQVSQKFLDVDKRITDTIRRNIRTIVLAGLGIQVNHWDRKPQVYETNGFKSELHGLISTIVQRDVVPNAKKVFDEIIKDKKFFPDLRRMIQDKFTEHYRKAFSDEIARLVTEAIREAEADFENECRGFQKNFDETIAPIVKAARAKVTEEIAQAKEKGQNVGRHRHIF